MPVSIYAIAAMAGCQRWESSLNPRIWESNIPATWDTVHYYNSQGYGVGGYGLGQWTNTQESSGVSWRLKDMYDWATAQGYSMDDGNAQLEYTLIEPYGGRNEGVWFNVTHYGSNAQTLRQFMETTSTDLDGLTRDFLANWEGVPDDHLSERQAYAREILAHIRAHINDDPSTIQWQSSTSWILPLSETMNNALCYYFYYQGYDPGPGPGPGPEPTKKKKWFFLSLKPRYKYLRRNAEWL